MGGSRIENGTHFENACDLQQQLTAWNERKGGEKNRSENDILISKWMFNEMKTNTDFAQDEHIWTYVCIFFSIHKKGNISLAIKNKSEPNELKKVNVYLLWRLNNIERSWAEQKPIHYNNNNNNARAISGSREWNDLKLKSNWEKLHKIRFNGKYWNEFSTCPMHSMRRPTKKPFRAIQYLYEILLQTIISPFLLFTVCAECRGSQ